MTSIEQAALVALTPAMVGVGLIVVGMVSSVPARWDEQAETSTARRRRKLVSRTLIGFGAAGVLTTILLGWLLGTGLAAL